MGRSVSYPANAIVAFCSIESDHDDDFDWEWEYECLVDDIIDRAQDAFPSLKPFDGWRGREDRILLRNAFADCGISTYCGLVSIWLIERDDNSYWDADCRHARSGRARAWLAQVSPHFHTLFGKLRMVGRFSNGEAVFEEVD